MKPEKQTRSLGTTDPSIACPEDFAYNPSGIFISHKTSVIDP